MSDTPDIDKYENADWWTVFRATQLCRELKQERDEARRELAEIMSCIEQAIDHHKGHQHFNSVFALMNLLDNINKRRKHDPR